VSVLDFAEVVAGRSVERERGHVIKVSLPSLLSRDEIFAESLKDGCVRQMVESDSAEAFVKGEVGMVGSPE
jgi:hypothetical protein